VGTGFNDINLRSLLWWTVEDQLPVRLGWTIWTSWNGCVLHLAVCDQLPYVSLRFAYPCQYYFTQRLRPCSVFCMSTLKDWLSNSVLFLLQLMVFITGKQLSVVSVSGYGYNAW